MLFVSEKTNSLTKNSIESLLQGKYIQASDELFSYLANNDMQRLKAKEKELNFNELTDVNISNKKVLYAHNSELSSIKILKTLDNKYLLYMRYLDDAVLLSDTTQERYQEELERLNHFIIADILILITLFLIILKMIYPLKKVSQNIKIFGEGNYETRVNIKSNDEIGDLANKFNAMASNIEELILARERLLRDIAHELKTPIAKSKFALEMMSDSKYKQTLQQANRQMDAMTNELLHIEKLNANKTILKLETFTTETLITEALSKLFIENESDIKVEIVENFTLKADLFYLSIALKNLIDNALKYSTQKPIYVEVTKDKISVRSKGKKLTKPLEYYCETFTQEKESRESSGYGLGLSLVKSVLDKHPFSLEYSYEVDENIFSIFLKNKVV